MKIIQHKVYSHNSLVDNITQYNKYIRHSKPLIVRTYKELVPKIAQIAYKNRDFELFFRGQQKEYSNSDSLTTLIPSIYRKESLSWLDFKGLDKFMRILDKEGEAFKPDETFKAFDEVKMAILQHYQVCDTPLLDITRSLRVASSFALEDADYSGILYVLGLPLINGSISFYVYEELLNIRLLGICPPQALRPYFQEGFLVGTFPTPILKEPEEKLYKDEKLDFGRRLIAKFELIKEKFWDDDFTPIPFDALFPSDDEMDNLCINIKFDDGLRRKYGYQSS